MPLSLLNWLQKANKNLLKPLRLKVEQLEKKIQKSNNVFDKTIQAEIIMLQRDVELGLKNQMLARLRMKKYHIDDDIVNEREAFHLLLEKLYELRLKSGMHDNEEKKVEHPVTIQESRIMQLSEEINLLIIKEETSINTLENKLSILTDEFKQKDIEISRAMSKHKSYSLIHDLVSEKLKIREKIEQLQTEIPNDTGWSYQLHCLVKLMELYKKQESQQEVDEVLAKIAKTFPNVKDAYDDKIAKKNRKEKNQFSGSLSR